MEAALKTTPAEIKLLNWKHSWLLAAFIAAVAINISEATYRLGIFESYFSMSAQAVTLPFRLLADFAIFWLFRRGWRGEAPSFLTAWAIFIVSIIASRIVISTIHTHETINMMVLAGLGLLIYGLYETMQRDNDPKKIALGLAMLISPWLLVDWHRTRSLFADLRIDYWMLYLLIAAIGIAVFEYISRRAAFGQFFAFRTLIVLIPLDFIINAGLFYGYRQATPSFIFAWGVYTLFDVALRLINNRLLREPLKLTHVLGMTLVIAGMLMTYLGGR